VTDLTEREKLLDKCVKNTLFEIYGAAARTAMWRASLVPNGPGVTAYEVKCILYNWSVPHV